MRGGRLSRSLSRAAVAAILAAAMAAVAVLHARGEDDARSHGDHGHRHNHAAMSADEGALSGDSLYHLESVWIDHSGREGRLGRFAGRPVVLAMIYSSCEFACPQIVADMMKIGDALSDAEREDARFVLVSFDPARDTPQKMREYRARKLPRRGWTMISAAADDVLELAAALGVRYKPLPDGEFAHSNLVFVIDAEGRLALRQEGLGNPPDEAVAVLRSLAARG